jgi:hypothetical protein
MTREDTAVSAMLFAYALSCQRSETRQKWTTTDQTSHEKLKAALLLYMDASMLNTSVMQARGVAAR